jgi:hypothetical protein
VIEVQGDELKIAAMLTLLGGPAALDLAMEDGQIVIAAQHQLGAGTSSHLRERLQEMIAEEDKAARVNVNSTMHLGVFGNWQGLNIVNAVGVDAGTTGIGTAIAIHEIWENYVARQQSGSLGLYGPAHKAGLDVEAVVATQISGRASRRVAAVTVELDDGDAYVLDYEGYFVVLTLRAQNLRLTEGRFIAQFHDRQQVQSFNVAGVVPGQRVDPGLITAAVDCLGDNVRATARITGLRTAQELDDMAAQRAHAVRNAMMVATDADAYVDEEGTSVEVDSVRAKGAGANLGARRPWTSSAGEIAVVPGVRIDIQSPV